MSNFKEKIKSGQLVVTVKLSGSEVIDEVGLNSFAQKNVRGLLKPRTFSNKKIEYAGPAAVSLSSRLKAPVTKYDFLIIMEQIADLCSKMSASGLDIHKVVCNLNAIYINDVTRELQFVYLPLMNVEQKVNLFVVMYEIIKYAKPVVEQDTGYIARFTQFLKGLQYFDANAIEKYIAKEDSKIVNIIKKHTAPPSGFMTGAPKNATGGPMGGPASGPMGGPVPGPMGGPVPGPMGRPAPGPMGGPAPGPMGGPAPGPMGGPVPGPMGGPVPGPMGRPAPGPMGGPAPGPMGGPVPGPMGGPAPGPIGGPASGPMGRPAPGPMGGPAPGPIGGPASGPIGGPTSGPIGGPAGSVGLHQMSLNDLNNPSDNYMDDSEATTLLVEEDDEATTLLVEEPEIKYAELLRVATKEVIEIKKPVFRLGKEKNNSDYCVTDNKAVSRRHADIIIRDDKCYIMDMNSTNKTYVNGMKLIPKKEELLNPGDTIKLGNEEFVFRG